MPRPLQSERADRMYAMYCEGHSLSEVGAAFGVARQTVFTAFDIRGWKCRPRKFNPTVEFQGEKYAPDPDGYFRKTRGDRKWLHHAVWEAANGPIPPGRHIHHRNDDKANNELANLACITPSAHSQIHNPLLAVEEHHCLACGALLVRKVQPSGRLETPAEVRRRRYCDNACHARDRRGRPKHWSARHEGAATEGA